jgi:hypothetical protein
MAYADRSWGDLDRKRALAAHLGAFPAVLDVRDVEGEAGPETMEITTISGLRRVPPAVVRSLGEHGVGVGSVRQDDGHWVLEVR